MSVPGNLYTPTIRKTRGGDYLIEQSLLFNDDDSAYLNRTPGSAGNRKTWTFSVWFKPSVNGATQHILNASADASNNTRIQYQSTGTIQYVHADSGAVTDQVQTNAVFLDPSAWYHLVVTVDTTEATAADRIKMWVNGAAQTFQTTNYPTLNFDTDVNSTDDHYIGVNRTSAYFDGLMALPILVDGAALDPTSFGEEDDDGYWNPIEFTGSFGTNGFVLDFSDTSNFGDDTSGNGNDYTPNNFTAADQLSDTPTDSADDEIGNFATLNPLNNIRDGGATLSNNNLSYSAASGNAEVPGTICIPEDTTDLWVIEFTGVGSGTNRAAVGLIQHDIIGDAGITGGASEFVYNNGGITADTVSQGVITTDTVVRFEYDGSANEVEVFTGGVSRGTYSWTPAGPFTFYGGRAAGTATFTVNPFIADMSGTVTAGAKAFATQEFPAPTIADGSEYFNTVLYTGDASAQSVTGVGFQPDLVWIKDRDTVSSHPVWDSVRGVSKRLLTDATTAEQTASGLTSFDVDGFTVGTSTWSNNSGADMVAWCWKAGGTAVSNTDGSITSSVSANTTSGFSIVTYTGIRPTTGTVGHGLNEKPDMIIFKNRADATTWYVWHKDLTNQTTYVLFLDTSAAQSNVGTSTFNNTAPTSTVFSLGNDSNVNDTSDSHVAYCWHSVEGFSKFGSYIGNGSTNGPFVYCGFKPAFLMIKRVDSTGSWHIYDKERLGYNPNNNLLYADTTNAEVSIAQDDLLSNGFKMRNTGAARNASGGTYIYMAFAENPFQGDDGYTQARAR